MNRIKKERWIAMKEDYLNNPTTKMNLCFGSIAILFRVLKPEDEEPYFSPTSTIRRTKTTLSFLTQLFHKLSYRGFLEKKIYNKESLPNYFNGKPTYIYILTEKGKAFKEKVLALDTIAQGCLR